MAYDAADGYVVLYGGLSNSGDLNDTWTYHNLTWTHLTPPLSPPARRGAAMVYDPVDQKVILFGGFKAVSSTNSSIHLYGDTWTFRGGVWKQVHSPPLLHPRWGPSMAFDARDGYVVLYGGRGGGIPYNGTTQCCFNDTWRFVHGNWTQLHPRMAGLQPTWGADTAYNAATKQVVLTAGFYGVSPKHYASAAYTWFFSGGNWSRSAYGVVAGYYLDAVAYDPAIRSVVLFSGGASSPPTYLFSNGSWSPHHTTVYPNASGYESATYDASDHYVLLFGGGGPGGGVGNETMGYWGGNWHAL